MSGLLLEEGFRRSSNDFCLLTMKETDGAMVYILVWVDDIINGCRRQDKNDKLRGRFSERLTMDDRCSLSCFLGKHVQQSPRSVPANQSHHIKNSITDWSALALLTAN